MLDLLNLYFPHFLLHSIKALYLTQRDSCWKGAKAFSHFVFSPSKGSMVQQWLLWLWWGEGGGFPLYSFKKERCFSRLKVRNSIVYFNSFKSFSHRF